MNQETDRNNYYDRARFGGGGVLLEEGYGIAFFYQGNELEL